MRGAYRSTGGGAPGHASWFRGQSVCFRSRGRDSRWLSPARIILLAVAFHGEVGIAGHSRLGRAVLIVFGASWLVYEIFATVVANAPGLEVASRLIGTSLTVLFGAAAFASAIFVVRAGVLHGFARWSLLLAALFDGALTLLSLVPDVTFVTFLLIWQTDLIVPLTLLIVGASYILAGRARGIALRMVTSR
jgi:hypothetical protein